MNDNYKLLAALNGIAVKCLIAFWWEKRQLTVTELEPRVGHDKNTVRKALAQLALFGLSAKVISSQETWCLTSQGYQLPLRDTLPSPADALMSPSGENFSPHVTTTATLNSDLRFNDSSSSSKSGEILTSPTSAHIAENEATLKGRGIMGKKAATIARLEWVDSNYINAHVDQVIEDGDRLGLAIRRMEDGDPAPEWCEKCGGLDGEHTDACPTQAGKRRPIGDEWPNMINEATERIEQAKAAPPMSAEMQEAADLWQQAMGELQLQLTSATYNTWLGRATVCRRENGTLIIAVHNNYAKDWLQNRLGGMIDRTLTGLARRDVHARFVVYGERVGGNK